MGPALTAGPIGSQSLWPLGRQLADTCRPVRERGPYAWAVAGAAAGAEQVVAGAAREERAAPVGVVAGVGDVLAGDPDRVAIDRRGAVVAPARTDGVREVLLLVAREPIVCGSAEATGNVVPGADAGERVDRRVRRARVGGVTRVGEGHHAATAGGDADRRIREVVAGRAEVAGEDDLGRGRVHDVPRDAGPLRPAIRVQRRVERAPELAVRVHHLLHPRVIRVGTRNHLRPLRMGGGGDEQLPATALTVEQQGRLVVQAVTLRHGRGRSDTRAGLLLLRRDAILADG